MAGGSLKSGKGVDGVTEIFKDIEQGGGEAVAVHIFLQGHRTVGVDIRCVDMGGYPPHGTGPGGFPRPGGAATYGVYSTAEAVRKVGVHLDRGSKRGDWV